MTESTSVVSRKRRTQIWAGLSRGANNLVEERTMFISMVVMVPWVKTCHMLLNVHCKYLKLMYANYTYITVIKKSNWDPYVVPCPLHSPGSQTLVLQKASFYQSYIKWSLFYDIISEDNRITITIIFGREKLMRVSIKGKEKKNRRKSCY